MKIMLLKIPDTLTLETPEEVRALMDFLNAYLFAIGTICTFGLRPTNRVSRAGN